MSHKSTPLLSPSPSQLAKTVERLVEFIASTCHDQGKKRAIVAVSGGIDSAVALTLTVKALGAKNVTALFLPYADQSTTDSVAIAEFNQLPTDQQVTQPIDWMVEIIASQLRVPISEQLRLGNIMARVRMITVYDWAKVKDALVIGTENKSEHYLGYFTRFGDAASDLEPLSSLYKTQVRQVARFLHIPEELITKPPSAGLWEGQTDEQELGFTYDQADQVLATWEALGWESATSQVIAKASLQVEAAVVRRVIKRVEAMAFKRQVPYEYHGDNPVQVIKEEET